MMDELLEQLKDDAPYKYIELYNEFNIVIERVDVTKFKDRPDVVMSGLAIFSGAKPIMCVDNISTKTNWDYNHLEDNKFIGATSMAVISSYVELETEFSRKALREFELKKGLEHFQPNVEVTKLFMN